LGQRLGPVSEKRFWGEGYRVIFGGTVILQPVGFTGQGPGSVGGAVHTDSISIERPCPEIKRMCGRYTPGVLIDVTKGDGNLVALVKRRWRNLIADIDLPPGADLEAQEQNKGINKVSHNFWD